MDTYLLNLKKLDKKTLSFSNTAGIIQIRENDDGEVVLVTEEPFDCCGKQHCDPLLILSFLSNQGIINEKKLTIGATYFPTSYYIGWNENKVLSSSSIVKSASDFESIYTGLEKKLCSKNIRSHRKAHYLLNLLKTYRDAHLLRERFSGSSYFNLFRVLDALIAEQKAVGFSKKVHKILGKTYISEIFKDFSSKYNKSYINAAKYIYDTTNEIREHGPKFNRDSDIVIFVLFYVMYKYRNDFFHSCIDSHKFELSNEPKDFFLGLGLQELVKIGKRVLPKCKLFEKDKKGNNKRNPIGEEYYMFLPKWIFLNEIVRRLLLKELKKL